MVLQPIEVDELEMQEEFFEHYLNAPITALFSNQGEVALPDSFKDKVSHKFHHEGLDLSKLVDVFSADLVKLKATHTQTENDTLKKVFAKYDADESGAIDKEELAKLSADLGHELEEDQLDAALKDLDLNGDGVIDYDEFKRWYFSGMKAYSGKKRSMLKFRNGFGSLSQALADPELVALINANQNTVKQSVNLAFNKPENPATTIKARVNLLG